MPQKLSEDTRQQVAARLRFYREMGIGPLYLRQVEGMAEPEEQHEPQGVMNLPEIVAGFEEAVPLISEQISQSQPEDMAAKASKQLSVQDRVAGLEILRQEIGPDCTRCRLGTQGRKQVVFGVGNVKADIMFVGEAPGADEDAQGEPFVGRAGQLLNNMIRAMGIQREDVYIANICKCRPPSNRTPEKDECATCSPFLMRQIELVKPKVIVALGAVAAKTLLNTQDSMANMRGQIYNYQGTKLVATYHPAYLLRDPRQKVEAWKDLQMVMKYLGMSVPARTADPGH